MESSTVKVRIPAGVHTGSKLRSSGKGEAGQQGGQSGDLYIVIHVKEHELFERQEDDLFCVTLKFQAAPKAAQPFACADKECPTCAVVAKATCSYAFTLKYQQN